MRPRSACRSTSRVRRGDGAARRPLHGGPGGRPGRDGAGHPRGRLVAACVWDHAGGQGPLRLFWDAARELDPDVHDESHLAGRARGPPCRALEAAGLHEVESPAIPVSLGHPRFKVWWEPFTRGVGPAGAYLAGLDHGPRCGAAGTMPAAGPHPSHSWSPPSRGQRAVARSVDQRRVEFSDAVPAVAGSSRRAFIGQQSTARCASSRRSRSTGSRCRIEDSANRRAPIRSGTRSPHSP